MSITDNVFLYKDIISPQYYYAHASLIKMCIRDRWRSLGNVKDGSLTQWTESEGFKALVELLFEGRDTSIAVSYTHLLRNK